MVGHQLTILGLSRCIGVGVATTVDPIGHIGCIGGGQVRVGAARPMRQQPGRRRVQRAAQGRPWIFREISHFLDTGTHLAPPLVAEVKRLLLDHLLDHYALYGEFSGVRSARKHIGWYVHSLPGGETFRARMNLLEDGAQQLAAVADYFDGLESCMERMPSAASARAGQLADTQERAPA